MSKKIYLHHIDGLRGIAVILVLLFHIDNSYFKGGYIGVDVFFVISGYLISTILINKIDSNTFSFKDFYKRRLSRLMPSLLFVIMLSTIMAYIIFPLHIFEKTLKSSTASLLSFSNILFFNESGYFDAGAHLKLFLHTWSLSVEEQFYFIWPLLLFFTLKIKQQNKRIFILSILGSLSLFMSEYWLSINSSAAFFLTPFRIFEFLIGTLLFWATKIELKPLLKEITSFIAISGLIVLSSYYDNKVLFPGINALFPCVFSAILIHNTGQATYVSYIYDNKVIRWFGKISYSLYLIHWPFIVFYKFLFTKELEVTDQIILFIASTIAGFFINKFVEIPFKESKTKNRVNKKVVWIFITILLIVTCNFLVIKYGSVFNNSKKSSQFSLKQIEDGKNLRFKFCTDPLLYDIKLEKTSHRKQVLLIGDSHTPDALNFLKLAYPNHDYRMISEGGCPPMVKSDLFLIDSHSPEMKNNCYEMIEKINTTDLTGYEFIVINILFEWYKPENLIRYIESINKKTNAKIIVFGNYVVLNSDLVDFPVKGKNISSKDIKSIALYEEELDIKSNGLYRYISKKKLVSKDENKHIKDLLFFTEKNAPMTYDSNHLSFEFAQLIADSLQSKKINVFN